MVNEGEEELACSVAGFFSACSLICPSCFVLSLPCDISKGLSPLLYLPTFPLEAMCLQSDQFPAHSVLKPLPCSFVCRLSLVQACVLGFPDGTVLKSLPAMQEAWVRSLWEDLLERGMATQPSTLVKRIPWTEEVGGLQSVGSHGLDTTGVTKQQQAWV